MLIPGPPRPPAPDTPRRYHRRARGLSKNRPISSKPRPQASRSHAAWRSLMSPLVSGPPILRTEDALNIPARRSTPKRWLISQKKNHRARRQASQLGENGFNQNHDISANRIPRRRTRVQLGILVSLAHRGCQGDPRRMKRKDHRMATDAMAAPPTRHGLSTGHAASPPHRSLHQEHPDHKFILITKR